MAQVPPPDPGSGPWAIEARGLAKRFGRTEALRGLDLTVAPGERVGLFGPNGAGKTTLIKLLATLLRPTAGWVRLGGLDAKRHGPLVRRFLGVVAHQPYLYDELTVGENLAFYGRMYGVTRLEEQVARALQRVGLGHRRHDRVRTLSRGQQQRVAIARAILHMPPILLLDEADTGLDEAGLSRFPALLLGEDGYHPTLILATHNVELGYNLCQRFLILVDGALVFQAPREELDLARFQALYRRYIPAAP